MHMVFVPCFNTSLELSALRSIHAVHTDTQTQMNTLAVRSCAGQHPSGRVLLSPAGSWQMPRLLPVITLDLCQTVSFSLCSTLLSGFLSSSPYPPSLPPLIFTVWLRSSSPSHPLPVSLLSCPILLSSSSVHSGELFSLQVSSGLSQHGWVAEGRKHGGLC